MGLAASQGRLLMLTARKSDLEFQLQIIQQARMAIANMMNALLPAGASLEPESGQMQAMQMRMAQIQQKDKILEMQANRIDTQHKAVQTEIDSVKKVIDKNIESSFKLMG